MSEKKTIITTKKSVESNGAKNVGSKRIKAGAGKGVRKSDKPTDSETFNKLLVHTPIIKDVFLGVDERQKASYIQLPKNFENNLLTNDVENGAVIYKPLTSGSNISNFTIIQASNLEMGYRAVLYKEAQRASELYSSEEIESYDADVCNHNEGEFDSERDLFDLSDDEYEPGDDSFDDIDDVVKWEIDENMELSGCYDENFSRIPIISMASIENYSYGESNDFGGFGPFGVEYNSREKKERPWWLDCTDESVCIVSEGTRGIFGSDIEAISERIMSALHRFENNSHVYVLIIRDKISSDDFSISRAILEFTANHYVIDCNQKEFDEYHHRLMTEIADEYGLTFSAKLDSVCLAKKLSSIDKRYPSATFDKIMRYIQKKGVGNVITPSVFEDFGLKQFVDKAGSGKQTSSKLDELQGMDAVKKQLTTVLNGLRFNKKREEQGLKPLNFHKTMVFLGAPGTAKTTVAKALTDIMAKENLIPGSRFVSVSGAQLKGEYVGHTAPRVHRLFEENDAIFIDEAYSLTSNDNGAIDMYAQEALAQLAIELEDHANDKLIIFAGYGGKKVTDEQNKMKQFIESNPGIKSRISATVYFDSYSSDEMVAIFKKLAVQEGLRVESGMDKKVSAYFCIRSSFDDFGNGREARVFLETCQQMLANRLIESGKNVTVNDMSVIKKTDMEAAIKYLSDMSSQQKLVKGVIGFA